MKTRAAPHPARRPGVGLRPPSGFPLLVPPPVQHDDFLNGPWFDPPAVVYLLGTILGVFGPLVVAILLAT